jgi:MFS family permease
MRPGDRGARAVTAQTGNEPSLRAFWLLTAAASVSELGTTLLQLAVPLIILASTGSSMLAAAALAAEYLPFVLSPAFGALIDGFDRRRVFAVAELVQGVLVALIPLLLMADLVVWVLLPVLLANCAAVVSNLTSSFSLVPTLVPEDQLTKAYSRYATATELARCAGPGVAGLVLATIGANWALWIDAATFLLTVLVATMLPARPLPPVERGFWRMQAEGFRSLKRLPGIPRLTAALSMHNLGAGAVPIAMVLLVRGVWGWSPVSTGVVVAIGAGCSALGAWLAGRLLSEAALARRISVWFTATVVSCALLLTPWHAVVVAGYCCLMVGEGGMNVTTNEFRFRAIPQKLSGRTNAVMRAFILGAAALSALLLGWTVSLPHQVLRFGPALLAAVLGVALWIGLGRTTEGAAPQVAVPTPK